MSYAADLSSYNAPASQIDWAQYIEWSKQGDGVSRLIIRACDGLVPDSNWLGYKQAAFDHGIDELYHYQFNNPDLNGPILEAEFLLNHALSSLRPSDSFMADYEKSVPQADGVWAVTWLERVMASIYPRMPVLYSYLSYINERLSGVTSLARFPLALADYSSAQPACPAPWISYRWWQFSDKYGVPGIPGLVDVNQFFGGNTPMFIPDGWTDNGTDLTAPNGVQVSGLFREVIISGPGWRRENVPAAAAYAATPLTLSDPALGDGQRQDFEYDSLGSVPSVDHAFFLGLNKEIAALKAQQPPATGTAKLVITETSITAVIA